MAANALRSFKERNVRIFFGGLWLSTIGTWAHNTGVVLLIRELGGGGLELGIAAAAQFLPVLFLGLYAGAVVERRDRHRLTFRLQLAMGLVALGLGLTVETGTVTLAMVYGFTCLFGTLRAFENPARRTFATELVPPELTGNVLALNASIMTGARMFGPVIAALIATTFTTGWVFIVNAISYISFLGAMAAMDKTRFFPIEPSPRSATPVRDGLRAAWSVRPLRTVLITYAVVATFAYNHAVGFPLLIEERLGRGDSFYGWMLSAMSLGSVLGSLLIARMQTVTAVWVYRAAFAVGSFLVLLSFATSAAMALVIVVPLGLFSAAFVNATIVVVQQHTSPAMRSRLLALTTVIFVGSTPIGAIATGLIGDSVSGRWANLYGGLVSVAAVAILFSISRKSRVHETTETALPVG